MPLFKNYAGLKEGKAVRKNLVILFAVTVWVALLPACAAPAASPSQTTDTEGRGTVVPQLLTPESGVPPDQRPAPAPPLVTAGKDVVIVYQSEGGIAGSSETMVIHNDGKVEIKGRNRPQGALQADTQQVAELVRVFEQENFFALQSSYLPQNTCCDRMIYTITYYRDGQSKSVITIDANPNEPAALQVVMQALNQFLAALG